jgi:DNA-binding NarL/FixJ family response regulator
MRRMLGVLRQQDAAPGPALDDLGAGTAGRPGDGTALRPGDGTAGRPSGDRPRPPGAGYPRPPASVPGGPALTRAEPAPLAPAPGLADLDRLIQRTRGAGVQVAVERSGRVRAVPAGVDLSAYRIIQEALTNVVKHAGAGVKCTVTLGYAGEALEVRVRDDGGGSPALVPAGLRAGLAARVPVQAGTGHGIIGMRERANLCGGEFSAGPLPAGGFQVTAALPLPAGAAAGQPPGDALCPSPSRWPTTRRLSGWVSAASSRPRPGSPWWARPPTARKPSPSPVPRNRTSSSWTCGCRCLTVSRRPARSRPRRSRRDVRVIILTTFDLDEYVFAALRAGASGFLLKDTLPADLLTAIRVVAAGEALLAPSVTRRLISEFARTPAPARGSPGGPAHGPQVPSSPPTPPQAPATAADRMAQLLTERECEVLRLVATGMSNAEIADELYISPATAKTHVAHLLTKLDARDRVQLVIIAYQAGLAAPA